MQPCHRPVAEHLGDDRGRRDREAQSVATHDALHSAAQGRRPVAVHQRDIGRGCAAGSTARAMASMVACRMLSRAISATEAGAHADFHTRHGAQRRERRFALRRAVSFLESSSMPARPGGTPLVKHDGGGHDRAGQRPAARFVHARRPDHPGATRLHNPASGQASRASGRATDARCAGRFAQKWPRRRCAGGRDAGHARKQSRQVGAASAVTVTSASPAIAAAVAIWAANTASISSARPALAAMRPALGVPSERKWR